MTPADAEREQRIFKSWCDLSMATNRDARKAASEAMLAEIRQRSTQRVAEMERERGLS